jgi:VanZ family protein
VVRSLARWLWLWGPPVGEMVALFWISSQPDLARIPGGISDKAAHFAAFFVLAALTLRAAAGGRWSGVNGRAAVVAFAIAAGYGALDELHQMLTPGRFPGVDDWVADALGALTALLGGLIAAALVRQMTRNRSV